MATRKAIRFRKMETLAGVDRQLDNGRQTCRSRYGQARCAYGTDCHAMAVLVA